MPKGLARLVDSSERTAPTPPPDAVPTSRNGDYKDKDVLAAVDSRFVEIEPVGGTDLSVLSDPRSAIEYDDVTFQGTVPPELIDPFGLQKERGIEPNDEVAESWEIDDASIGDLEEAINTPDSWNSAATDETIVDWFSGPGGLIEAEFAELPGTAPTILRQVARVELDATVALHRSIELLATDIDPIYTHRIRDGILAALAKLHSEETRSTPEPARLDKSSAVVTSAVVVGVGAVMVARRKRANTVHIDTKRVGQLDDSH